jgi:hypothetical protein
MPRTSYRLDRVLVEEAERRRAAWTFGGSAVRGTEQAYTVVDTNFPANNRWEFIVRLPEDGDRIEVRPRVTPTLKAWAELTDRSLTFMRATLGASRGQRYCQVALADVTGERSKDVVRADQRNQLPRWFDGLRSRMRTKENVKRTRGTDGGALVLLVPPGDHAFMIRLFFAMKVWVLKERFVLDGR